MQWSKTKKMLESFLCEKLQSRIQIHATVYRKFHDQPSRVWIMFDKQEILSASDMIYNIEHEKIYQQIKSERKLLPIPTNVDLLTRFHTFERKALVEASVNADSFLLKKETFQAYDLYKVFMEYNNLSIEEALESENNITKAFAMFDRRLGKRRLRKLTFTGKEGSIIVLFYKVRCQVENIAIL
ncbi:SF0329 family protein [Aquibacillus rhizosphaerae]|uniref:Nonribosomal peptide synthetase n=1 Tax=Aquibacillus rhizosphaerae TaxID=3051431 RepID=A0ABT7L7F1_9BACI|nr:nonribosomal peptide synthetase [Aquibacillus sp. LR5S19]MDL4841784.1 nonribosomal peptide synthetase [Aquibacillus sp. LR5S19]